jgi:hypothetical protein
MSINRKDLDDGITGVAVVEGGHKDDPDPQRAGRVRIRDFLRQGPLVLRDHLPFVQQLSNPHGQGQHEFTRPPRPGQLVKFIKTVDGYKYVQGIVHGVESASSEVAGGKSFESVIPQLGQASKILTGMNIPAIVQQLQESNRTGLQKLTKKLTEKSEKDRHELYRGLPTHGAMYSMTGLIQKPLQQVATALTEQSNQLTSELANSLGGSSFSLGNILQELESTVLDKLSPDMKLAVGNMQTLMSIEATIQLPGNFTIGGRVNPTSFLKQAFDKISVVANIGDLDKAFQDLQSLSFADDALSGIEDIVQDIAGLFGGQKTTINAKGEITHELSSLAQSAESAFSSLVSNIPSAASNLFSGNTQIPTLLKRLKDASTVSDMKTNLETKSPEKKEIRQKLYQGVSVTRGHQILGQI